MRYQPGTAKEIEMNWDETTGTTTSCMTNSNTALKYDTNTNMKTPKITNVENALNLRASKLIELCQAKIDSMEENIN